MRLHQMFFFYLINRHRILLIGLCSIGIIAVQIFIETKIQFNNNEGKYKDTLLYTDNHQKFEAKS
jgi:hypothetical protein